MKYLSVRAAQRRIISIFAPVGIEQVNVSKSLGRVLAGDVRAVELPRFDNSSVDGFALRAADVERASFRNPRQLRVVADVPAGKVVRRALRLGEAARIMTGAPLPPNADAVVMLEDTDSPARGPGAPLPALISIFKAPRPGQNVRRRGADARIGHKVLRSGDRIRPQEMGLLAMLGRTTVHVHRRPIAAILSSGDELTAPGNRLRPGRIYDTNSMSLAGLVEDYGCVAMCLGVARDDARDIAVLLDRAVRLRADIILTSAGVSVGAFDLVRDVLMQRGELLFWRVNVRPGKPLALGRYRGVPVIGLPGNPVSAFVGFELFVKPALTRLCGAGEEKRPVIAAILADELSSDGRESYLRARIRRKNGTYVARLSGHQGSGNLLSLVDANALLVVPAGVKSLAVGDQVEAWLL